MSALGTILHAFEGALGCAVRLDDDYFELGGDSLMAVSIMKQVSAELGIEFPIQMLFESGSIRLVVRECLARAATRT